MVHAKTERSGSVVTWLDIQNLPDGASRETDPLVGLERSASEGTVGRERSASEGTGTSRETDRLVGRERSASEGTVSEMMRGLSSGDMRTVGKRSTVGSIIPMPSTPNTPFASISANEKLQVLQYENQDLSDHVASVEGKLRQKVQEVEVLQQKITEQDMHLRVLEEKLEMGHKFPRDLTRRAVTESAKEIAGALALARQRSDENDEMLEQLAELEDALEALKADNERLCAELARSEQLSATLREEVAEERARRMEAERTVENEREILREARDEVRYLQEELQDMRFRAADGRVVYGHEKSVALLKSSNDARRNKKLVTHNLFSQMENLGASDTDGESMATESVVTDAVDGGPCNAEVDEPEDDEAASREAELTQTINELRQRLKTMEKMASHWRRRANETWWQRMSQQCCTARPMEPRVSNMSMAATGSNARLQFQAGTPS